jgi:hypothetical protein
MTRPHLAWALTLALLIGAPYGAAEPFLAAQHEARLLDAADSIIAALDEAEAPFADMEPEEDEDNLVEASLKPTVLCPDVRPFRQIRGGRT